MRNTITRPCPTCLPDSKADFDYDRAERKEDGTPVRRFYRCRNCRHEVAVTPRPAKKGGPRQSAAIQRMRDLLADGPYTIEEREDPTSPRRRFYLNGSRWFDRTGFVCFGARGSVEVTYYTDSTTTETVKGPRAWTVLKTHFGRI